MSPYTLPPPFSQKCLLCFLLLAGHAAAVYTYHTPKTFRERERESSSSGSQSTRDFCFVLGVYCIRDRRARIGGGEEGSTHVVDDVLALFLSFAFCPLYLLSGRRKFLGGYPLYNVCVYMRGTAAVTAALRLFFYRRRA